MNSSRFIRVRTQITSAADLWLAVRMCGWALLLPVLKRVVPIRPLVRLLRRSPDGSAFPAARIVLYARWAARAVRWRSGGNCLERSLLAFRYLGASGAQPTLVVGLAPSGSRMIGHAWVLLDGRPVGETNDELRRFTAVMAFACDGTLVDDASLLLAGAPT
jgi:hypothetical protein